MTIAAVRCHYGLYRLMIHFIKKIEGKMRGSIKANVKFYVLDTLIPSLKRSKAIVCMTGR
jgi:hypothetical protein